MKRRVKVELRKLNTITEAEASAIQDVWQLDLSSRWQLYRYGCGAQAWPVCVISHGGSVWFLIGQDLVWLK